MEFEKPATSVSVWAVMETAVEVDLIIAWLQMAKRNMEQWRKQQLLHGGLEDDE